MSYVFDADDKVIWSPALRVGQIYVGLADALSCIVSVPHGLSAMASDYYEVDGGQFRNFVEVLTREYSDGHRISQSLLRGFILTSLVLLERMGSGVNEKMDADAVAEMLKLSSAMPEL